MLLQILLLMHDQIFSPHVGVYEFVSNLGFKEKGIFLPHLMKPIAEFSINAYATVVRKFIVSYFLSVLSNRHLPTIKLDIHGILLNHFQMLH